MARPEARARIIEDSVTEVNMKVNDDGSINTVSLSNIGTRVMQTGTLVTTDTNPNQVVLSYTVTAGKKLFLQYLSMIGYATTAFTTGQKIGEISLESPAGMPLVKYDVIAQTVGALNKYEQSFNGIPIPSETVIRVVCTPSATASRTWIANFGGFEL
jgi:hypothetical protein